MADYHDYVFKNGKLVAEFDRMYKESEEVPWHQDKTAFSFLADLDLLILSRKKYRKICDVGCGLGYFSKRLQTELETPENTYPGVTGLEISADAVCKARQKFPDLEFHAADLLKGTGPELGSFDLVVCREVLWYVCQEIDVFFENLKKLIGKDGSIYIAQSFPKADTWVGKEVLSCPDDLLDYMEKSMKITYHCIEGNSRTENWHTHILAQIY